MSRPSWNPHRAGLLDLGHGRDQDLARPSMSRSDRGPGLVRHRRRRKLPRSHRPRLPRRVARVFLVGESARSIVNRGIVTANMAPIRSASLPTRCAANRDAIMGSGEEVQQLSVGKSPFPVSFFGLGVSRDATRKRARCDTSRRQGTNLGPLNEQLSIA